MAFTPFMNLPYPGADDRAWYTKFWQFIMGVDQALYASMEDRNLMLFGGGLWSFVAGTLAWSENLEIDAGVTGYRTVVPAGSWVLPNNWGLYVDVTRGLRVIAAGAMERASVLGRSNVRILIARRRDDLIGAKVYFRNGLVLFEGDENVRLLEWGARWPSVAGGLHGATHAVNGPDPIPGGEREQIIFSCPAWVSVGDAAYQTGSDALDMADYGAWGTMPAFGIVESKPTDTSAIVCASGELSGFVGLVPDVPYYVGAGGGITEVRPVVGGQIRQRIGWAKNSTTLVVDPGEATEVAA